MTSRHAVGFEIPNLREERAPTMSHAPPEVVDVILAPFSATSKMSFEEVPVGSIAKQSLNLRNPSDSKIKVVLLIPKDMVEHGLAVSSTECEIPPHDKISLEITFQPTKVVSSHHTVKIVDHSSRRPKGHFQLTCISAAPTKKCGKKRKVWDKQPCLPLFGCDQTVSTSTAAPATWVLSELSVPVGGAAPQNRPNDTTFTLSPLSINSTYVCSQPAEANGKSPSFNDSLENDEPGQLSSKPDETNPSNTSKAQRHLVFGLEDVEKENHISPKKRRTANISISDIGFDSLTPDHPVGARGPLKSMENLKNSFSSFNFSTPVAKKGLDEKSSNMFTPKDRLEPVGVVMKMEPVSPGIQNSNSALPGPSMTPNFKAPQIRCEENSIKIKSEPVTPFQPTARMESFSARRSVARVEPIMPEPRAAKIEPLQLSRLVAKVEALTPVPSSSKPLLAFEMSPPTRFPVIVRKELFGRPHVTSTPMEASRGKPRNSQRNNLSPKSLPSFKKKNVRVYKAQPATNQQSSSKTEHTAPLEDPAHTLYQQPLFNLDIYGTTTMCDPFGRNAIHPLEYQDKQSRELIKWVNSVLTLPEEYSEVDAGVDVVALWKKSNASDTLTIPASREMVCSKYHKNELHLYNLRKSAHSIFQSKDMTDTLYHVHAKIDTGYISVKDDIDLHCDQGVRCHLVQLLMHYNPLWLRIGLEAIYGRNIQVQPKRPSLDLIIFIKNNFLSDKYIMERNSYNNVHHLKMPKFKKEMNDYIVFKYLSLIFFLDVAKKRCIIPYDPCLFRKESPIKESEGMLNEFIKEFIKCVSHMKRTLASWGYTLTHKQTALDEFNFAVHSHLDLRDGASLTRLMEVILRKKQLIQKLRLPAISRLQKIHNVKVAFAALEEEKVELVDVEPKDVVDAHREKIMSLLWQILHKFLKPRLENAAIVIQMWWRKQTLKVEILRRIRAKEERKKDAAAVKIQALWKGYQMRKRFPVMKEKLMEEKEAYLKMLAEMAERAKNQNIVQSAVTIQKWFRATMLMRKERSEFVTKRKAIISIQLWYRATHLMKKERLEFIKKRQAAIKIQEWYRATVLMRNQRNDYSKQLCAAKKIQQWYRATLLMKKEWKTYQLKLNAAIKIQQWFKTSVVMKKEQAEFIAKKKAVTKIQHWLRANALMKKEREEFKLKRIAAIKIQIWYRSVLLTRRERADFEVKKKATIKIQQRYRANVLMKKQRKEFELKRSAAVKLQNWYRSVLIMRKEQTEFEAIKQATIKIQQRYRANALMKKQRKEFELKRNAAIKVQNWFQSILSMRKAQAKFKAQKKATMKIQQWYRASALMKKERKEFESKRRAAIKLQNWYRSILLMKKEQAKFKAQKKATMKIQRWYRASALMKIERKEFESKRRAAIKLQNWYRSILLMKKERAQFKAQKKATMKIQQWYRASALMKKQRKEFESKRHAAIKVQNWYRSILLMKKEQAEFEAKKKAVIKIQKWYRASALTKKERREFESKRHAAMKLQNWYRSILLMKKEQAKFKAQKKATMKIQQWYRASALMKRERKEFESKRRAAIKLQNWYRSILLMKKERAQFKAQKKATMKIQQWYRASALMKKQRKEFESKRHAAMKLQNWYRSILLMKKEQAKFKAQKKATMKIQQWYRASALIKRERKEFESKRRAAIKLQNWYRSILLMKEEQAEFEAKKKAVIKIQKWYRASALMKRERKEFESKRHAAMKLQSWYRAILLMKKEQAEFEAKRKAAIMIQRWCRATALMEKERSEFEAMREAAIKVQQRFRANVLMKKDMTCFKTKRYAAIKIQQWFKARAFMMKDREEFVIKRMAAIKIQQHIRAFLLMRKERAEFINRRCAILKLQQRYRATALMKKIRADFLARCKAAKAIAKWYESLILMRKERTQYIIQRNAAIKIQQWYKATVLMKKERKEFKFKRDQLRALAMKRSMEVLRNEIERRCKEEAARKIVKWYQSSVHTREMRLDFIKQKLAAIRIQVWYKNILYVRKEGRLQALKRAAQNANNWNNLVDLMRQERLEYARKRESDASANSTMWQALNVVVEQALNASHRQLASSTSSFSESEPPLQNSSDKQDHSIENATALAEHVAAAKLIQDWYRRIQLSRKVREAYQLRRNAVIKIQRFYRAYRERVAEAKEILNGETAKPKQLSIGENYENSISVILNGNSSFHHLFVSFKNIDFALTHSTGLCERMVQSENSYEIVRAIYHYLSAENRSDFYQTVFDVAMNVILEAISYEVTYNALWEHTKRCGGVEIILQFMGKFLEKGEPLFCKAATILWAFTRTHRQINEIVARTDCKDRLNYYYKKIACKASGQRAGPLRNAQKTVAVVLPTLKRNGGYSPNKPTKRYFSTRLEALTVLKKKFS